MIEGSSREAVEFENHYRYRVTTIAISPVEMVLYRTLLKMKIIFFL